MLDYGQLSISSKISFMEFVVCFQTHQDVQQ